MIGFLKINIFKKLPKIGDRLDYSIQISGPGETSYKKKVSITRTLVSVWNLNKEINRRKALEDLVCQTIFD